VVARLDLPESASALYENEFVFVWRNLRRLGVDSSLLDDATHDVFIVVLRRLPEFVGRSSVRTWLFGILYHVAQGYRRKVRGADVPSDELDYLPGAIQTPEELHQNREELRVLHQLLGALGERRRAIFILMELEEMSAPEVAEALNLKLNTVYSGLRLARAEFQAAFHRHNAS